MHDPGSSRRFDVLLWGATGFTGQLVAETLVRRYGVGQSLRWAIGGRSREKLERVREALSAIDPRARELAVVVGDSGDRASLDPLARDAHVVCSTVGPYALHGRELVGACVEAGTDYCDLTGEPQFVRAMIDLHHARARVTGARIVHCCGYDSIPSDLGTLVVQEHARAAHASRCTEVKYFAGESKGGMSGGTAASMMEVVEESARDRSVRRLLADPYALDPARHGRGPDGPDQRGVRWDRDLRRWTGPFVMAAINTRVVRRSNALLGYAWGEDFRYSEAMSFGAGAKGFLVAAAVSAGVAAAMGAVAVRPVRRALARRVLPASGEGPSRETRERGYFVSRLVGTLEGAKGKVVGEVRGQNDPGYGETSKMLSEAAVCLALDGGRTRSEGGVLTPASCMGMALVERLRAAGMTFTARDAS
ncbi:MAG TPA: saccharopine dehydrogenase NADP-binding domain-containing protein [Polyangiaceae bacterium]